MREAFRAYYRPTHDELTKIWADGIIILDTNTLLNLFRYSESTRDEFLSVLEKLRDSLWIPHHVGLEFHQRRLGVVGATSEAFGKITSSFEKASKEIETSLNAYKHHPSLNRSELSTEVSNFFQNLTKRLNDQQQDHHKRVIEDGGAEQTFQKVSDLLSGKVGTAFTADELADIYEEGKLRYQEEIPPGYKDKDDTNQNQYGDLIIWKEILRLGAEEKRPVIFVTDDTKEDWWWRTGGETQGPRVELVDEYWAQSDRRIHFYQPMRFLEYAKGLTNTDISPGSLREVGDVSSAATRTQSVLQERQRRLERRQASLLGKLERGRSGHLRTSGQDELRDELEALISHEQRLEDQLQKLHEHTESFVRAFAARAGASDPEPLEDFERFAVATDEIKTLTRYLEELRRRRNGITHRIQSRGRTDSEAQRDLESQLDQIQEELRKIKHALEELSD